MNDLFSMDGKINTFLNRFFDVFYVFVLTCLCSVPIVTMGAALTAQSYTNMKIVKGYQISVRKTYFKSFGQNLKQAVALWLPLLFIMASLVLEIGIWLKERDSTGLVIVIILFVLETICMMLSLFGFSVLSRFTIGYRQWLRVAIQIMLTNLSKGGIAIICIVALPVLIYMAPQWLVLWLLIPIIFSYYWAKWMIPILKKYEPKGYVDPELEFIEEEEEEGE